MNNVFEKRKKQLQVDALIAEQKLKENLKRFVSPETANIKKQFEATNLSSLQTIIKAEEVISPVFNESHWLRNLFKFARIFLIGKRILNT